MNNDKFHRDILPLKDKLYRTAFSILRNQSEAEDVVQDIFLKLWTKREEWSEIENIEAFCFRATKNLALDRLETNSVRRAEFLTEMEESHHFTNDKTPDSQLIESERNAMLYDCIEMLPENQKMIFHLREIEELGYKEIANILSISEESVKVNLFRARKKMRDLLSKL